MNPRMLLSLLLISPLAMAGGETQPSTTQAYREECGACHVAYPPALLAGKDWKQIMNTLSNHFGDDASLDPAMQQSIEQFLQRRAGKAQWLSDAGNPPRITQTWWFTRQHNEVPGAVWKSPKIKSPSSCQTCHRNAERGSYRERDIAIPGYGRYEDD